MKNSEWYIDDIERGIFAFGDYELYARMKLDEVVKAVKQGTLKGKVVKLYNNICIKPDAYVICGDVALKATIYFLKNGKISQILLQHGKKNEQDEYTAKEKYGLSLQFLNALLHHNEAIYSWGSVRTFITNDGYNNFTGGEVYITLNHKPFDPYKA